MGLGFGARGETVQLENGDGGGDGDSLRFYVAITLPQMPLSEIDGVVNLFSARRAKERHLIFCLCWRDCSVRRKIKFLGWQTVPSAQQRPEFWAVCPPENLISHHVEQSRRHTPKIRCLSFALRVQNRFSTPSILDNSMCGNVMAT